MSVNGAPRSGYQEWVGMEVRDLGGPHSTTCSTNDLIGQSLSSLGVGVAVGAGVRDASSSRPGKD